jgi:hypothetical protein
MTGLVDAFIALYLLVAGCSHLRRGAPGPVSRLVARFGFRQVWGMFAPDPAATERSLFVLLPCRSGGALRWDPPGASGGFRRRLLELMALSSNGGPVRRVMAEYLVRKYDFADGRPAEALFVCTERRLTPPWLPPAPPPTTFVFDTIPLYEPDDSAERAR